MGDLALLLPVLGLLTSEALGAHPLEGRIVTAAS
jgi:hypothetical protein